MPIENLPKGAIKSPEDPRDFKLEVLGALPPVDWSKEFRLPNPGDEDQGSSESCVAQSFSYFHNEIHPANYSRRDLYARIFLPQGGAYLRDGAAQIVANGQATRDEVPDPSPQTEAGMRDKTGVTASSEFSHKELAYYSFAPDIDTVAAAIKAYNGAVIGVYGSNPGWQDLQNPRPPKAGETKWGHALYCMGYHLHNRVKCIIAKSSWCNEVKEHHIKADYFQSGNTFDNWTIAPKKGTNMDQIITQAKGPERRIVLKAATEAQFEALCAVYGKDPSKIDETV
jgi:hypothetical protein